MTIELSIKSGLDINQLNSLNETALMLATISNSKEVVEPLIKFGADKTLKSANSLTAYEIAKK